jgi:hypothetical protein
MSGITEHTDDVGNISLKKFDEYIERATLRDHFAMAALTGLIATDWIGPKATEKRQREVAELSYDFADAMLEARKQNKT